MGFPGSLATPDQFVTDVVEFTTPDAAFNLYWSKVLPPASMLYVNFVLIGRLADGTEQEVYEHSYVFSRTTLGNVAVCTPQTDWASPYYESHQAKTYDFGAATSVGTQTASLTAKGIAGTTVYWKALVSWIMK